MTARTIPVAGEPFLGDDPAVMKVLKVTFGDSNQDVNINDGDTTVGKLHILTSLPYGIHVYDVGWRVITAFNGGVDITLGYDSSATFGSDCDFFAKDAYISCSVIYANMRTVSGSLSVDSATFADTNIAAFGFTPDSNGNNLVAHVWQGDTVNDSGVLEVYVYYHSAVSS